jgi:hypothetical protein
MKASKAETRAVARWGPVVLVTLSIVAGLPSVQCTNQTAAKPGSGRFPSRRQAPSLPGPISLQTQIPSAQVDVPATGGSSSRCRLDTCDKGQFRSWTEWHTDSANSHHAPGQLDTVYMVDVDRRPLVIDAAHMPATSALELAELKAILASMIIDRG